MEAKQRVIVWTCQGLIPLCAVSLACSLLVGLGGCAWWVPVACAGIQMLLAWPVLLREPKHRGVAWWLVPLAVLGGAVIMINACGYAATCGSADAPSYGSMAGVAVAAFVCYVVAALVLVIGRNHDAAAGEEHALLSVNQV